MPRERPREGLYSSSQVAKILGISTRTLYRKLAKGELPEPMRNDANNYRRWSEADVQRAKEVFVR